MGVALRLAGASLAAGILPFRPKSGGRAVHINIKNIVKNNAARFSFYRAGYMYYEVAVDGQVYRFPVSLEDLGTATLPAEHKAITLMRDIPSCGCFSCFMHVFSSSPLPGFAVLGSFLV